MGTGGARAYRHPATGAGRRRGRWLPGVLCLALALQATAQPAQGTDVDALAAELETLKERLAELEGLRERVRVLEQQLEEARAGQSRLADADQKRDLAVLAEEDAAAAEASEDGIGLGGALRFNLFWNDFDETVESKRGAAGLDLFRISADGSLRNLLLSAEYRFYPFMQVIHHGWVGYEFADESRLQVGITRVPFGLLPYAAHNFWFGAPYYLGLSDDYDLGVKYRRTDGAWEWQAAFFKNGELSNPAELDRYSLDVVSAGDSANEEANQGNLRAAYTFGVGTSCSHEVGVSAQFKEIYNAATDRSGSHWAGAGHLDTRCGRWNLQLQAVRYGYSPKNPPGVPDDTIRLGGFGSSYDVASRASVLVANVAYNLPVPWTAVDQVTCYNDYSIVVKDDDRFRDSRLNTTGCLVGVGPLYVYLDLIRAENMIFFGDGSLAGGDESGWDTRFNINVGYYW